MQPTASLANPSSSTPELPQTTLAQLLALGPRPLLVTLPNPHAQVHCLHRLHWKSVRWPTEPSMCHLSLSLERLLVASACSASTGLQPSRSQPLCRQKVWPYAQGPPFKVKGVIVPPWNHALCSVALR